MLSRPIIRVNEDEEDKKTLLPASQPGSNKGLSVLSLILHVALIAIHLTLLIIWQTKAEHNFIFPLQSETLVSNVIVAIASSFGTIYFAVLVNISQTLSVRQSLRKNRTLTAIHDETSAWRGIGSALLRLWEQKALPAAPVSVFSIVLYLANIGVLHVSTPALFSIQIFNFSQTNVVQTQGFPTWDFTQYNMSNFEGRWTAWDDMQEYVTGSLALLPAVFQNANPGLDRATIYNVPPAPVGTGNLTVAATSITAACGYIESVNITNEEELDNVFLQGGTYSFVSDPGDYGTILSAQEYLLNPLFEGSEVTYLGGHGPYFPGNNIILYTNITILDSDGSIGSPLHLNGSKKKQKTDVLYLLQCSLGRINHTAVIDAQSQHLLSVQPNVTKTCSTWEPALLSQQGLHNLSDPLSEPLISMIDLWPAWYSLGNALVTNQLPDTYLNQELSSILGSSEPNQMMLHDVENALARAAATIFWTVGNTPPTYGYNKNFTMNLEENEAVATEPSAKVRTDMSIVALLAGLTASIALTLLSIRFLSFRTNPVSDHPLPNGTSFLHAIWLYRSRHREFTALDNVEKPTNSRLRLAGVHSSVMDDCLSPLHTGSLLLHHAPSQELVQVEEDTGTKKTFFNISDTVVEPPPRKTSQKLSMFSITLHSVLVAFHIALLAISRGGYEHRFVFSFDTQPFVSRAIIVISTSCATIYCALLVYVLQTLSTQRSLQKDQTLTTTHDEASSWAGIGSALLRLWDQRTIPAGLVPVLHAALYLGNILVLHISTPALVSVQVFNSSRSFMVQTQSFPVLNLTHYNMSSYQDRQNAWGEIEDYASGMTALFPYALQTDGPLGLHRTTLYGVPTNATGPGNITVGATGLNMTCGYLPPIDIVDELGDTAPYTFAVASVQNGGFYGLANYNVSQGLLHGVHDSPPVPPIPGELNSTYIGPDMIIFSDPNTTIVDSKGNQGSPAQWSSQGSVHLMRCSLALVNQTAIIDGQTRKLISVEPETVKTSSTWQPAAPTPQGPLNASDPLSTPNRELVDLWQAWYVWGVEMAIDSASDAYLNQELAKWVGSAAPTTQIQLHDVENTMASVIAALFWSLGNTPETYGKGGNMTIDLEVGQGWATELSPKIRINLNKVAILAGLVASLFLTLISMRYLDFRVHKPIDLDGTGFLQAIWLVCNHPRLEMDLEQVENPTDKNLRRAGMIRVKLAEAGL